MTLSCPTLRTVRKAVWPALCNSAVTVPTVAAISDTWSVGTSRGVICVIPTAISRTEQLACLEPATSTRPPLGSRLHRPRFDSQPEKQICSSAKLPWCEVTHSPAAGTECCCAAISPTRFCGVQSDNFSVTCQAYQLR
jgi:hypothetical protein